MSDDNQSQCTPEGDKTQNLIDLFSENDNNINRLGNILFNLEENENHSSIMNTSSANNNNNNFNFNNINIGNLINPQKKRRKYDSDSLRKKIKGLVLRYSLEFINGKIQNKKDVIKKIKYDQTKNTDVTFEKEFMYKTLEEIFSEPVQKKYTKTRDPGKYNKKQITKLKSQSMELKNIFNIKFIECLNYFFGNSDLEELNGMKTFEDTSLDLEEKHKKCLIYYANNYEDNVLRTRPRKKNHAK